MAGEGGRKRPSWLSARVPLPADLLERDIPDVAAEKEREKRRRTETPAYRLSKEQKSVRVYTVGHESRHIIVHNVPSVGVVAELVSAMGKYGPIERCVPPSRTRRRRHAPASPGGNALE